ncbi:MAG: hypothetical protein WBX25_18885 [Rhodomicrobium sp.]
MTVLSPVLSENISHNHPHGLDAKELPQLPKQDMREYLADMLRELSSIAAWAELDRVKELIDRAISEAEQKKENQ